MPHDARRGEELYENSLAIRRELGDVVGIAECFDGLARVDAAGRRPARAAQFMGPRSRCARLGGPAVAGAERQAHEEDVVALSRAMGPLRFEDARRERRAMTLDEALLLAVESSESPGTAC